MHQTSLTPEHEARERILASVPQMGSEALPLRHAVRRVACEDIVSEVDLPRHANSSMDGFALRHEDTAHAKPGSPVKLRIVGESSAGNPFGEILDSPRTAVRIMTGGLMPEGSNAVVEVEKVQESDGVIRVAEPVERGKHIRFPGEDVRRGEVVVARGTILMPPHIGLLASLGSADVGVSLQPSVALITTGSELVDIKEDPSPGQIKNSSAYMIPAYVREAGGRLAWTATIGDDQEALRASLERAFQEDVVITTGGISVGKYDLVGATLNELKVDLKVSKVNIKPGKPFAYGVAPNGTPVFCLPGNPVSSVVTFVRFVQPAILRMMGGKDEQQSVCRAILEHDIPKNDTKEHLLRGVLRLGSETPSVRLTGSQSSGVLTSLVKANCLVILPPESRTFLAGESVEIQML